MIANGEVSDLEKPSGEPGHSGKVAAPSASAYGKNRIGVATPIYFVVSAAFHYMGPTFAVLLFARLNYLGVAWLRIATAALVFLIWTRPWRYIKGFDLRTRILVVSLGLVLAAMNVSFYTAISKLPLGTVAAIEFLSPIGLAVVGTRTSRNLVSMLLAVTGVYTLARVTFTSNMSGYLFAFANCILFGLYIVLGHKLASEGGPSGIERISASMCVAFLVVSPVGIVFVRPALSHPSWLLAGLGVGICSSVIPYACDQMAMARLGRSTFAFFLAILPATASLMGAAILRQIPTFHELLGIALVTVGVATHSQN
jgi:inner membrane transporter RhtA